MASACVFCLPSGTAGLLLLSYYLCKGVGFNLIVSDEVCFVPDIANLEKQSFVVKMLLKVVVAK
jgi:hypothetical protein